MIGHKSLAPRYQASWEQRESEFMNAPNMPASNPYAADLQTCEYNLPIIYSSSIADDWHSNLSSAADPYLSWLEDVDQQLEEVRQEAEEACLLESEIDPIPEAAYDNTYWLLEMLFDYNAPMPDIGWLADGGIGFEWRSQDSKGIATISMYGDNQVIYGASLGGARRVKGTCNLSDLGKLTRFFRILTILCSQ